MTKVIGKPTGNIQQTLYSFISHKNSNLATVNCQITSQYCCAH